jgi:hypothetical protein
MRKQAKELMVIDDYNVRNEARVGLSEKFMQGVRCFWDLIFNKKNLVQTWQIEGNTHFSNFPVKLIEVRA